ncbi:DUF6371 domain-containing protein [Flavobacterium ovatum]|uniref:DUF6371 domain-containing protein n=1 Tax=Flavobacterium ovatum TaxID=1928857 RepID=UPI0034501FEF
MFTKVFTHYKFNPKRNYKLVTPCCNRTNKDGKFINYLNLPDQYGYCHSCGKQTIPPPIYKDENGNEFTWNSIQNRFEKHDGVFKNNSVHSNPAPIAKPTIKYINEAIIWEHFNHNPENNLLSYLRKTYGNEKVDDIKLSYTLGSTIDGGTVFWNINSDLKVQKAKICYYNENGKRTNKFKVPYKNEDGYYACLFGAHLVYKGIKGKHTIILVESEKTAIVGAILLPQYVWVAYGGINGLTDEKTKCLIGHSVVIIPDMSENAVAIMYDKLIHLRSMGINASIWDMTKGRTDQELKDESLYNCDLEDVFRNLNIEL